MITITRIVFIHSEQKADLNHIRVFVGIILSPKNVWGIEQNT